MGLDIKAIARSGARLGFQLADAAMINAVLWIRPGAGQPEVYDPATDMMTSTADNYNVRGLKYQTFSQKNADDSQLTAAFLVEVKALEDLGLTETPNDADYIVIDNVQWTVTRVDPDPVLAVYVFQLRRT